MTIVSDHTALLTGASWAGEGVTGAPVVVTYSFPVEVQRYLESESPVAAPAVDTWMPLSSSERQMVVQSLASWSAVAGVTFVEVAPGEGDLTFSKLDLSATIYDGSSGFAYSPGRGVGESYSYASRIAGDVFFDTRTSFRASTVTHEIGHTLGLKHPFVGEITLDTRLDQRTNTTMSYSGGGGEVPGPLDIDAARHIYGPAHPAKGTLNSYAWHEKTSTLTQIWGGKSSHIWGSSSKDSIEAGAGSDTVVGYLGNDTIEGGNGRDLLFGNAGRDTFLPGRGDDTVFGGDYQGDTEGGIDTVDYSAAHKDISIEFAWWGGGTESAASGRNIGFDQLFDIDNFITGSGDDTVTGNDAANRIETNEGADSVFGSDGADVLKGGRGRDTLDGGAHRDRLEGGKGNDLLLGNAGKDWLEGGNGRDTLDGGGGNDKLEGGRGSDVFVYSGRKDRVVDFTDDVDTIRLDSSLWRGAMSVDDVLLAHAFTDGATKSVFDFGGRDVLTIAGITDLELLRNDIEIV